MTALAGWTSKEHPLSLGNLALEHVEKFSDKKERHNMRNVDDVAKLSITSIRDNHLESTIETVGKNTRLVSAFMLSQHASHPQTALFSSTAFSRQYEHDSTSVTIKSLKGTLVIGTVGFISDYLEDYAIPPLENIGGGSRFAHLIAEKVGEKGIENTFNELATLPYSFFLAILNIQPLETTLTLLRSKEYRDRKPSPYLYYHPGQEGDVVFASLRGAANRIDPSRKYHAVSQEQILTIPIRPIQLTQ